MSPLTLRRTYLPRNTANTSAAHPAAAAAAATAQKKPPVPPQQPKENTEKYGTTDRNPRIRRFKPGFEEETERELARIFKRPPRTYTCDPPFYPWLPITPKVCFNLNFKF
nr:MAG: hypothetical protein [Gammatorquevirus sp.]